LHLLCGPLLAGLETLPLPQQEALRVAFGLASGRAPDRFVVGLASLGLLAEAGSRRPLVCLVDDAQWLDEPSRQVVGFVGRRLMAEAVLLLLAVRESRDQQLFPALPSMTLEGLAHTHARALLMSTVRSPVDEQVRDRVVAESRGNPLRLIESAREMNSAQLGGGFGMPPIGASSRPLEEHYTRRIKALPIPTQQLLLVASADPTGDAALLWRAARASGITRDAALPASADNLLEIGFDVRFRHPLIRCAQARPQATT
jgi:hypothetical protein